MNCLIWVGFIFALAATAVWISLLMVGFVTLVTLIV